MRTVTKLALAVAVGVALMAGPALALCPNAEIFSSTGSLNGFAVYSYVQRADLAGSGTGVEGSDISANIKGFWWNLGTGNPLVGPGDDSGSWPALETTLVYTTSTGWLISYANLGFPGAFIAGTWAQDPRIDNCVELAANAATACQTIVLEDTDGSDLYLATMSKMRDALFNFDFSQAGNASIVLGLVPKPAITGSSRAGNDATVNIAAPGSIGGTYLDGSCAAAIQGYKIYQRIVARGAGVGAGRDRAQWTALSGVIPTNQGTSVLVDCSEVTDQDAYLAQTIVFADGFETTYVSKESTRVECGPQLAEPRPVTPRPHTRPERLPNRSR